MPEPETAHSITDTEPVEPADDEQPDLIITVDPWHDQSGIAGHGSVGLHIVGDQELTLRMTISANCDYMTAHVELSVDEARDLEQQLAAARAAVAAGPQPASVAAHDR